MESFAIYATMKARPGKEAQVEALLERLARLAADETGTKRWFALKGLERTYSIFDTFDDQEARTCHLEGELATALLQHAPDLFEEDVQIAVLSVLAGKEAPED